MPSIKKLREKLRNSPTNTSFAELTTFIERLGFIQKERRSGSHVIYGHPDFPRELVNLQRRGNEAKPYQVRQVLDLVEKLELMEDE